MTRHNPDPRGLALLIGCAVLIIVVSLLAVLYIALVQGGLGNWQF